METCTYGSEAGCRKPTTVRWHGADSRAYVSLTIRLAAICRDLTRSLSASKKFTRKRLCNPWQFSVTHDCSRNRQVTVLVTKFHLTDYILIKYILSSCGQSADYPHFFISFSKGTFPETPAVHWHRRLFFVKRAFGNPHKSIEKWTPDTLVFPARTGNSLMDWMEQELFPCFPACKSSSLSSPPAGKSFLSFQ